MNNLKSEDPILSICIPTHNRAEYLDEVLGSITSQTIFIKSYCVQIVISDNASTDHTADVCKKYITKHKDKIVYTLNDNDLGPENIKIVLSKASGKYLKLNNDTFVHKNGSLDFMVENIKNTDLNNKVLIFNFGNKKGDYLLESLDEFVKVVDYYITWIAIFGISRNHFTANERYFTSGLLPHVPVLLETVKSCKVQIVCADDYFSTIDPIKKGGYDVIDVFLVEFSNILRKYLGLNGITKKTFDKLFENTIFKYILPNLINQLKGYNNHKFIYGNRFRLLLFIFPKAKLMYRYILLEFQIISYRLCLIKNIRF
jgi:abequosyltransferase